MEFVIGMLVGALIGAMMGVWVNERKRQEEESGEVSGLKQKIKSTAERHRGALKEKVHMDEAVSYGFQTMNVPIVGLPAISAKIIEKHTNNPMFDSLIEFMTMRDGRVVTYSVRFRSVPDEQMESWATYNARRDLAVERGREMANSKDKVSKPLLEGWL